MAKSSTLAITDIRGGRNGFDPPTAIPDDQCREALNVDWWEGTVANKRAGASAIGTSFSSGGPFAGVLGSLIRHVPAGDETAAELWGVDAGGVVGRLAGATTWTAPTLVDTVSNTLGMDVVGASLGGFLHLGYDSNQNRSHVWDASLSKVRRTGLATPSPPTVATQGGAGLSFTRHYRIRIVDISGSNTRRRSEASTSVSITISDDAGVTVTKPSLPGEDETHWEVEYAAASTGPWYRASQVLVATSTYSDTAATISTTNLSAVAGINTPPPSYQFCLTDDTRLIMVGTYESSGGYTTPKTNRVWWTPRTGDNDVGDSERVLPTAYRDLEDTPTGIGGPIQGAFYVFSYRRIWKFVPTDVDTAPYQRFTVRKDLGCIRQQTITMGEDEFGNPALYFLSTKGPYRIGPSGIQYLGMDIEDLWSTVLLGATRGVGHGVYHADKHQVWWWVATSNDPDLKIVFDVKTGRAWQGNAVRRGWARHVGDSALARCSVMFSYSIAAAMGRALKPHIGQIGAASRIYCCDDPAATADNSVAFQAYVDTKEYGRIETKHAIREGALVGQVATGVTITVTPRGDYALTSGTAGTALLTAAGAETHVVKRLEGMQHAGIGTYGFRIGDASAVSNAWTVDAVVTNVTEQEAWT